MMGKDHSANVLHMFTPKKLHFAQLTNEALCVPRLSLLFQFINVDR